MKALITRDTPVTQEVLNTIAHLPTRSLAAIVDDEFFKKLADHDFMRIAALLARKGYEEGGCPIGAVIVDDATAPDRWQRAQHAGPGKPSLQPRGNFGGARCRPPGL